LILNRISTDNLTFEIDDVVYTWGGYFGRMFTSREKGMKIGDVRIFGNTIFKVIDVRSSCWGCTPTIIWVPAMDVTIKWIDEFKKAIFGV
jgi:hypothetical protein